MKDTTRLNARLRETIKHGVVDHRFGPEFKSLVSELKAIADEAYTQLFSISARKLMQSLPAGWLEEKTGISVNAGGESHYLKFAGDVYFRNENIRMYSYKYFKEGKGDARLMPHSDKTLNLNVNDELAKRLHKALQLQAGIEEAFTPVLRQVNTMIKSYTTIGTLKEAWPEVAPFIPKTEAKVIATVANLPAVSVPELNRSLGLPV